LGGLWTTTTDRRRDRTMSDSKSVAIEVPAIEDFEAKIIAQVAHDLLYTWSMGDGEQAEGYTYPSELGRRIKEEMVEAIKEQAREFAPVVAAEILERGVPVVDRYGDATGRTKTLKSMVADEVVASMKQYGSRKDELGKMVRAEISAQVEAQMKGAVSAATAPIMEAVRDECAAFLQRALAKAIDVPI
jgi:hypothetical protein